jgi:hypothetical protein
MTHQEWRDGNDLQAMLEFVQGKASERKLRLFAIGCVKTAWNVLELEDPHITECCRLAVDAAERHVDGLVDWEAVRSARMTVQQAAQGLPPHWDDRWGVEAAMALTDSSVDSVLRETTNLLAQIEDFADNQASMIGVSGLCVVTSQEQLARMIDEHRAQNLPLGYDWERTLEHWDAIRDANPWSGDAKKVSRRTQAAILRDILGDPLNPAPATDPGWLLWNAGTVARMAQAIYDNATFDDLAILGDALEDAGCRNREILEHCRSGGLHVRGCWVLNLLLQKE